MRMGQGGSCRPWRGAALFFLCLGGCLGSRGDLDRALLEPHASSSGNPHPSARYHVHCPDVLEITVQGRGAWSGARRVAADGRIDLGDAGKPRVEGLTTAAITRLVAHALNVPPSRVEVAVSEFNSQQIYLHGEVQASQRAIPYRGPETVVELLQRAGGLSVDAAPRDIQVVRANIANGGSPEVYHVDLEAILI